jgi:hypothetical protein
MKLDIAQSLDRILESAVIVSWADLMKDSSSGLIHLEHSFAPDGSLESLKILSSETRGHWYLACDYWMSASTSHGSGIHFENGYRSVGLARTLEFIMEHQRDFVAPPHIERDGLLQIRAPTEEESAAAANSVREAFCRINSYSAVRPLDAAPGWAAI